ncbi:hypothetical protein RND81_10G157600 [Saponaria officinalis]|uniref:Uncharacterized protein n=1 Tax=Saponaria officinalis TaxID=3572 RepID=A0AAW1I3S4_SAPOF
MGNALRFLYHNCCQPTTTESGGLGPHGISAQTASVSALARDLLHFEATSQVPDGLNKHVVSSKKAQANWYKKLIPAWKEAKPPPRTPEEAGRLIVQTLKRHQKADVEGLLAFYGLPHPDTLIETSSGAPSSLPDGVKYELHTLPVDVKAVADGDTVTAYVSTKDPRESSSVPREVQVAAVERAKARAVRDYVKADALHKKITDQNYRVISVGNEEVLAKKYRIRLRN